MREPLGKYIKDNLPDGFLLIACGLPGTGKSTALAEVQKTRGGKLIISDVIRRELLKDVDVTDPNVAADMKQRERVYEEMFHQADEALNTEKNVILDATFITQELRQRAATLAAWHKTTLIIMETVCPEDICLRRILKRNKSSSISNALTVDAYQSNKNKFEDVDMDALKKLYPDLKLALMIVDTSKERPYVLKYETG